MLTLDLGNSLPTQSPGGPLGDSGPLSLALLPSNAAPVILGSLDYLSTDWYPETAGIVSLTLSQDALSQAQVMPVDVVSSGASGIETLVAESLDGDWVRADDFVFRFNPGDSAETAFYASNR